LQRRYLMAWNLERAMPLETNLKCVARALPRRLNCKFKMCSIKDLISAPHQTAATLVLNTRRLGGADLKESLSFLAAVVYLLNALSRIVAANRTWIRLFMRRIAVGRFVVPSTAKG
jgi:hypothetical protein